MTERWGILSETCILSVCMLRKYRLTLYIVLVPRPSFIHLAVGGKEGLGTRTPIYIYRNENNNTYVSTARGQRALQRPDQQVSYLPGSTNVVISDPRFDALEGAIHHTYVTSIMY